MTLKNVPVRVIITMMARLKNGGLKPRPLRATPLKSTLGRKSLKLKTKKRRKSGEITKLKKQLWELCKQITRKRYVNPDGTWTCYTSGQTIILPKNVHTGHFIPSSLCSVELRYDLRNLRPQSYNDNINHSGNPHQFRRNLTANHGVGYVEELETRNEQTKGQTYTADWFTTKIAQYTTLLEELQ